MVVKQLAYFGFFFNWSWFYDLFFDAYQSERIIKVRRVKLISLLMLGLVLIGCATVETKNHFYGISMNGVQNAKDFKIVSDSDGEIRYYKNDRTMNPDIYAWAKVGYRLYVSITNDTKNPIGTNYFTDDFELMDKDGRTFKLEKDDIMSYPEVDYINPGETARFPLKNPFDYDYEKLKNETAMIVCTLGSSFDRVTIVLKPLPEEQNISTDKK